MHRVCVSNTSTGPLALILSWQYPLPCHLAEKTCAGECFSIVIENPGPIDATEQTDTQIYTVKTYKEDRINLPSTSNPVQSSSSCRVSQPERQKGRALASIDSLGSLIFGSDNEENIPGLSAFCAQHTMKHSASKITYLPLIPESPTNPP